MKKAILFDFGGTLDTDGVHWSEKFWDVYQRLGITIGKPDYEAAYVSAESQMAREKISPDCSFIDLLGRQVFSQLEYLVKHGLIQQPSDQSPLHELIAEECYHDVLRVISISKGILAILKQDYALGLVSNFNGNLITVCKELGIYEYFSAIVDSAVVGVSKPDPEIFRIALEQINVDARNCIMVGDSYDRDIVPAKTIGCVTIWLHGRSWREPEATDKADFCIRSIEELLALIKSAVLNL